MSAKEDKMHDQIDHLRTQPAMVKIAAGMILLAAVVALIKLLCTYGHCYISKAQDNFYNSLWLNENRANA